MGPRSLPAALALLGLLAAPAPADDAVAFFEKKVRPILVDYCSNCHSADTNAKGGLRVDDRNGLLHGGGRGPAVVPGQPDRSLLLRAVRHADGAPKMPPKKALSEEQIADLTKWIADGAAWPAVKVASGGPPNARYDRLRKEHWAWQPLKDVRPPAVKDAAWPRDDVDRFVLAALEAKGLRPVADADKLTLLRRVTFDLTGLPPTPAEVRAFLADDSADAYAKVVDRLLASPAFGEQWGRHWLDVARYGESTGSSRNLPLPHAWRYRDWVIDAVNADKPFDRFIAEQIAGDLLPAASPQERDANLIATGFLALGVKDVNQRFKVRFVMDNIDEQIDTVTRSVLGLTASCARCHDHKFDPIPQADYYALAGIFQSTDLCAGLRNKMGGGGLDYYDSAMLLRLSTGKPAASPEQVAQVRKDFEKAKAEWDAIRGTPEGLAKGPDGQPKQRPYRLKFERLQAELQALTDPAAGGDVAFGARDAKTVGDTEVRVRGEAEKLGPVVPRGFLTVLDVPGAAPVNRAQSGRLELARWLASRDNPLTPRVLVNRVWHHLFGAGLVASVDNFGVTGDAPSHPELLDHLAARFVRDGWSLKRLVRALVLSRAYRLGGDAPRANVEADPANRLLWRHSPRRLTAEEMRDAALAAAGALDRSRPSGSPARALKVIELADNGPLARKLAEQARDSRHRSVYLPLVRNQTPAALAAFDPVEQGMVTGRRDATTVAPQALYLLNDPFVWRQSLALADRLLADAGPDDTRIAAAYQCVLSRPATAAEVERAKRYLAAFEATARDLARSAPKPRFHPAPLAKADGPAKPPASANPDEADQTGEPVKEEDLLPADPKRAAWGLFCQALFAAAEYRYLR
jgi:cytochrome c553